LPTGSQEHRELWLKIQQDWRAKANKAVTFAELEHQEARGCSNERRLNEYADATLTATGAASLSNSATTSRKCQT